MADCCLCSCSDLCVTVEANHVLTCLDDLTGVGVCNCDSQKTKVSWDPDQCAYVGTVTCDAISIDVNFEIKKCAVGGVEKCHLCLTSTCLGLTGACPDQCKEFTPGHKTGECGTYLRDCTQSGGWNKTWTVDASGCGDVDCTSVVITVECMARVNPAGKGVDRICKNCDCVCKDICLTYSESGFDPADDCISQSRKVTWDDANSRWQTTFTCPAGSQTLTITLVRNSVTGCCKWKLESSKGTVNSPDQVDTTCPSILEDWTIDLGGGDTADVHVECADCECADAFCCCPTYDDLPDTLYATLYDNDGCCPCADGAVIPITLQSSTVTALGKGGSWKGTATVCGCTMSVELKCDNDAGQCQWLLRLCMWGAPCPVPPNFTEAEDCATAFIEEQIGGATECTGVNCCNPLQLLFGQSNSFNQMCCCDGPPPCTDGIDGSICVVITE